MKALFLGLLYLGFAVWPGPHSMAFAAEKNIKIAMVQWRGETEACRGFVDAMQEMGYAVQYTVLNAGQDRTELGRLLREELLPSLKNFDYVYSYGTTASKGTKFILNNSVPHVFSNVAAPVKSAIADSMQSSGGNMSGTSNRVPLAMQIEIAHKVIKFRKLGLLFNPREKNAMVIRDELYRLANQLNFEVVDLRSPPVKDSLEKNLQKLIDKTIAVDAVYLPLDSFLLTQAPVIGPKLRAAQIKSIAAQKKYIQHGALFGVIPDYYRLGKVVARIVDRHRKGEALQHIAIETPKAPLVMINKTTATLLDVKLPNDLLKNAIVIE